jgi:nucleotide-binding universal stress UspA family protein
MDLLMQTMTQPDRRSEQRKRRDSTDHKSSLQISKILVPLDFSRASMHALKYTIPLAEYFKATIHLGHVQPGDEFTSVPGAGGLMLNCADAIALMQDRLAEVQEKHDVRFWPDNCHVVSGRPYEEICKLARELHVDLIVLPTRGHSGLKRLALGSTAERVIRCAPCPVLIPRGAKFKATAWSGEPMDEFSLHKILVPIDFSDCSLSGLNYAALLAKRFNAKLRLVHVIFPYIQIPLIETARAQAEKEARKVRHLEFMRGIACETKIRTGSAIDEICAESARSDVDLMVTSTHGRTGFEHALIGSVAEHVVRYAEAPMLVVPSHGCA